MSTTRPLLNDGVIAEGCYLGNLLVMPVLFLIGLRWWQNRSRPQRDAIDRTHLQQAFTAGWRGLIILALTPLPFLIPGLDSGYGWMAVLMLFITVHTTLVILGIIALAYAMAGKAFRYPLIGPPLAGGDDEK